MKASDIITVKRVVFAQSMYYLVTAIWPFVSSTSFQEILGPKQDWWLVQTFSLLIAGIAIAMLASLKVSRTCQETRLYGLSVATVLATSEVWFVVSGTIRVTYLIDAVVQLLIVIGWLITFRRVKVSDSDRAFKS